jgi:hypothetical protein
MFLHKGLNVVSQQKIIINYFILVENFECIFTMSIQGRAACVSSEHTGTMWAHPGAMEAHLGAMELTLEA